MSSIAHQLIEKEKQTKSGKLDLGNCGLSDIPEEIYELTWLEELSFCNEIWESCEHSRRKSLNNGTPNKISIEELSPKFEYFKSLRKIYIGREFYNKNKIVKFDILGKIESLETLYLVANKISDIGFLRNLKQLKSLNLSENEISNCDILSNFKSLRSLNLGGGNKIVNHNFLKKLDQIQYLDLSSSRLSDYSFLENLKELKLLRLEDNLIKDISFLIKLNKLKSLVINSNLISDISPLQNKVHLKYLYLHSNKVVDISPLNNLNNLLKLNLIDNQIINIRPLQNLTQLEQLYLGTNRISDISYLSNLINLQTLHLHNNQIKDLEPILELIKKGSSVMVKDNPLTNPPLSVYNLGYEAVLNYFQQIIDYGVEKSFEAKILLVGDGGAGKTSLMKKLFNDSHMPIEGKEKTTLGITIKQNRLFKHSTLEKTFIKSHIWDFGGQDIQYALHQYFLTDDSLYILVIDNRKGETRLDYWFRTIDTLCENGKVLVFRNNREDDVLSNFPLSKYRNEFPNLNIEFTEANLAVNDENWIKLRDEIIPHNLTKLQIVGQEIVKIWKPIKDEIFSTQDRNYISITKFQEICAKHELTEEKEQSVLISYLHNIGVALYFKQDRNLTDVVFINPNWIINGLYVVLSAELSYKSGYIYKDALIEVWKNKRYSIQDRAYLLRLILKDNFDICYELSGGECYILPIKLSDQQPEINWDTNNNLVFRYRYNYIPTGLLNQLIVRLSNYIHNDIVWQKGVILKKGNSYSKIYELFDNINGTLNIEIRISKGDLNNKKELLTIIRKEFEIIHNSSYKNIDYKEMVMCNCSECIESLTPTLFDLQRIENNIIKGKPTIECSESSIDVEISSLIGYTFDIEFINQKLNLLTEINNGVKKISENLTVLDNKIDSFHDEMKDVFDINGLNDLIIELNNTQNQNTLALANTIMDYIDDSVDNLDQKYLLLLNEIKVCDNWELKIKVALPILAKIGLNFEIEYKLNNLINGIGNKIRKLIRKY